MEFKQALDLIGGLSNPSKMPWYGWSTPAKNCITGSKLHEQPNTTCSKCYALKGRYMFPNVQNAMKRRFAALTNPEFENAFVLVLETMYKKGKFKRKIKRKTVPENRFRWHDSGDLQGVWHLEMLNRIAKRTPYIQFYLPTREMKMLRDFIVQGGVVEPNLKIMYSVPLLGARMNSEIGPGIDQSSVGREDDKTMFQCVAPKQGNQCLNCDKCWVVGVNVNYHLH